MTLTASFAEVVGPLKLCTLNKLPKTESVHPGKKLLSNG